MFSSLKIGLVLVMLAGAGGGYLYVNKLQKDNAVLKTNQIKLETAVQESNQVIEQQTKDLKKIRSTIKQIEEVNAKLQADRDALNKRLGKQTMIRIGLVWTGNPDHTNDHNRSLLLKQFSSLLALPFEFHSLQKDLREVDAQTLIDFPDLYQHQDELQDFSDTAALIDAMDIIISVDTSVAHLVGAMEKKLWLLLPYLPDFRWMLDREDSPWYPSAKLYRQEKINDWDTVLEKLKADLLKLKN